MKFKFYTIIIILALSFNLAFSQNASYVPIINDTIIIYQNKDK